MKKTEKPQKDDPKQRIIDAALDEFLISGYDKASMRSIAAQAGMTVGNIYLYFTGKEQLFDALVGEPVAKLRRMMEMQASDEGLRRLAMDLHQIFIERRVEFLILISRSEGSPYQGLKRDIIEFAKRKLARQFGNGTDERRFSPIAVALVEGLLDIFHQSTEADDADLGEDLYLFLNYMLSGLTGR